MQEHLSSGDEHRPPFIDYLNAGDNPPASESGSATPPPPPPQPVAVAARRPATPLLWFLTFLLTLLVFIVLLDLVAGVRLIERISYSIGRGQQRAALETLENAQLTSFSHASKLVAEGVVRSVVPIEALDANGDADLLSSFMGSPEGSIRSGQGSGVIVDDEGYVLTNHHVIAGAKKILVHLPDRSPVLARVVGYDPLTDLAVLKVDAGGLLGLNWGNSDELESGDPVWAVGSPYGLDNSITMGIVSAKGRHNVNASLNGGQRPRYENYLQTDAAVNPGNSGGALVNIRGELVGINTAIVGPTYQGISFAIPSRMAREVYESIRENNGVFNRGWLGVRLEQLTHSRRTELGIEERGGALVVEVIPDSPAEKAGLSAGDLIVQWGDQKVADQRELLWQVATTPPGSEVEIVILRDQEQQTLSVSLVDWPSELP